jgi:hypothetical protein
MVATAAAGFRDLQFMVATAAAAVRGLGVTV